MYFRRLCGGISACLISPYIYESFFDFRIWSSIICTSAISDANSRNLKGILQAAIEEKMCWEIYKTLPYPKQIWTTDFSRTLGTATSAEAFTKMKTESSDVGTKSIQSEFSTL